MTNLKTLDHILYAGFICNLKFASALNCENPHNWVYLWNPKKVKPKQRLNTAFRRPYPSGQKYGYFLSFKRQKQFKRKKSSLQIWWIGMKCSDKYGSSLIKWHSQMNVAMAAILKYWQWKKKGHGHRNNINISPPRHGIVYTRELDA